MASQTSLLGAAGEHFVMSELLRRGFIAALAPYGVPNTDIIVTDVEGSRLCSIQVKTRRQLGTDGGWHMSEKHENIRSEQLFYCFIEFSDDEAASPQLYIVPSNDVADVVSASYIQWRATPGRYGQERNETQMRRFLPDYSGYYGATPCPYPAGWLDRYRNHWEQLRLQALPPADAIEEAE